VYSAIPPELRALIEPIALAHGLELVDVSVRRGRPPWRVQIILDTPSGDGRVPVDRCASVSREVGTHLDAEDLIERAYHLEVSSPGLDRVLAREKDFAASCGFEVSVETRRPLDGRKRFRGLLESFEADVAKVRVDGTLYDVPFSEIARGKRIYDITSADFSGLTDGGSKNSKNVKAR
jgi:ribosome maturation factor RimP